MRKMVFGVFLIALLDIHFFTLGKAFQEWKSLPREATGEYVLPAPLLKITSLEFDDIISDYLFLKTIVFIGDKLEKGKISDMPDHDWQWIYHTLDVATDLDPYFIDPYITGNAWLAWEGRMAREANMLLEKGSHYRDWDWTLPFFIGFNHFYFLRDNEKAAAYLAEASKRPGPNAGLASLASRLAFKAKKTENAIMFLEVITKKTEDRKLNKEYEKRLTALRIRLLLEKALRVYKQKYHTAPREIEDVVKEGIIENIPTDPYGGTFSVDAHGELVSTSDNFLLPGQR